MQSKTIEIFNLEFPDNCSSFKIGRYKFSRVRDYEQQLLSMSHLINSTYEFEIKRNTGQHAVTAIVTIPTQETESVLPFDGIHRPANGLSDVLLLLSLFTGRDVFAREETVTRECLTADHRCFARGGILALAIPYKPSKHADLSRTFNQGFVDGLNDIYKLIQTPAWRAKYKNGALLILAYHAFKWQPSHIRFILAWTIWEHLFCILTDSWMSPEQLRRIHSVEKIAFIFVRYGLRPSAGVEEHKSIKALAAIRNDIVHFGLPSKGIRAWPEINLFLDMTEFVIAQVLGLTPNKNYGTVEELGKYLAQQAKSSSAQHQKPSKSVVASSKLKIVKKP